jgi:hypothetical protein
VFKNSKISRSALNSILFSVGLAVSPLFYKIPAMILIANIKFRIPKGIDFLFFILMFTASVVTFVYHGFINSLINALFFLLSISIHNQKIERGNMYKRFESKYIEIWFLLLLLFGLFNVYTTIEFRVAFLWGEINFTGFWIGLLFVLMFFHGVNKKRALLWLLAGVLLTLSRSLFVVGVGLLGLNLFIKTNIANKVLMIAFSLLALLFFFNFEAKGYAFGMGRLMDYNDSSSNDRLYLMTYWFSLLVENPFSLLFGLDQAYLNEILYNEINIPHNSYIEKVMNGGLFSLLGFLWLLLRMHSIWIIIFLLLYGFLLHGLFSIQLLIILQIFSQYNYKSTVITSATGMKK